MAKDGTSFTGGDSMLTAFLIQQMGGTTWRCQNPNNNELHSKSGYFYSQNTLITDTTNWSNAGMGYQGKSGPNCSTVNNETCLVIKGNALKDDNAKKIFKTRVLANIINTARMYAYQRHAQLLTVLLGGLFRSLHSVTKILIAHVPTQLFHAIERAQIHYQVYVAYPQVKVKLPRAIWN